MSLMIELPEIDNKKLAMCTPAELIEMMIEHEDRVPRNVIDECVRRGEQMLDVLTPIAQLNDEQADEIPGHWWLGLHAVMILGLIPGEPAGRLLVVFIHSMCRDEDGNLQEWFSGYWPALMRNKSPSVNNLLKDICADKNTDWFMRANVTEAVIAHADQQGEAELDSALDWVAQFAADEQEDWEYRLSTANDLLDYPRERHRDLIAELADQQSGLGVHFNRKDIDKAYARGTDTPNMERFNNPWQFYEPTQIEARQRRWQKEDQRQEESDKGFDDSPLSDSGYHLQEPWQRETAKVGRNDPCPCGSGKKYKKCCLN